MPSYVLNPQQTVGEFLPSVYINKITLTNSVSSPQDLKVELIITVKDVVAAGNLSKWFSIGSLPSTTGRNATYKTLRDYIKINIIQTTTQEAALWWSGLSNNPELMYGNVGTKEVETATGRKVLGLSDFDNGLPLDSQFVEYDANGNSIRNMSHALPADDFKNADGNIVPPNDISLAYFVWASFDIAAMAADWRVDANSLVLAGQQYSTPFVGKTTSDIVFRNSKLVSEGYIFFEAEKRIDAQGSNPGILRKTNKLWTGLVHYEQATVNGQGLILPMGGRVFDAAAHALGHQPWLVRQRVPYKKVQDFRNINRLNKLKLDFSIIENELLGILTQGRGGIVPENPFAYFTDIFLSRDQNNNCRFLFGIDLPTMVRENSPYSQIFAVAHQQNPQWLSRVMSKIQILSMKIYRKRTVGSSEVGTSPYYYPGDHRFDPVPKLKKFDNGLMRSTRNISRTRVGRGQLAGHSTTYDPSEELIICASETPNAAGTGYNFGSYSEDGGSQIRFLTTGVGLSGRSIGGTGFRAGAAQGNVYYFTGTDATMFQNTDGYYQYKIEIEVEDKIVDLLIEERAKLLVARKRLQDYYSIATSTNGKETNQRLDDLGLQMIDPKPLPFFNPTTNRFTQAFTITSIAAQHSVRATDINNYINILKMFVDLRTATESDKGDEADIKRALKDYIRPTTGNPEGILVVLNLYESLISFLNRGIGIRKEKPTGHATDPALSRELFDPGMQTDPGTSSSAIKTFKIEHTFEDYFDANLPLNYGFDFLGAGYNSPGTNPLIPSATGLRVINFDTFENSIVINELKKLFSSPTAPFELRAMKTQKRIDAGSDLKNTDFTFLTPAVVYPGVNSAPLALVGQGTSTPPNVNDETFMNMAAGAFSRTRASNVMLYSTDTLQEQVADFLSYNYNLTAVPDPEPRITINDPGTNLTEQFSSTPNEDYFELSNAQTEENRDAFNVFWGLISNGVVNTENPAGVKLPEGSNQKTVDYYSVTNTDGFWNAFEDSIPMLDSTAPSRDVRTAEAARNLPNPIKALIRYNDEQALIIANMTPGTDALKPEIDTFLGSNPFITPKLSAKARILFDTIGQIDYLDEFGTISPRPNSHDISVNMDQWLPLNRQIFTKQGRPLLCRIRPWENSVFKTERQPGNNLPTYEEYFLLVQGNTTLPDNSRQEDAPMMVEEAKDESHEDTSADDNDVPADYSNNSDYEHDEQGSGTSDDRHHHDPEDDSSGEASGTSGGNGGTNGGSHEDSGGRTGHEEGGGDGASGTY